MQGRKSFCSSAAFLAVLAVSLVWTGCATAPPSNVKMVQCTGSKIEWQVAPEAEITKFDCALGTHGGEPSLIYSVGLKNLASQPYRFRLGIFLPEMDKAVSYLVPTKGKPPQLAAGEETTVKIPFMKTTTMPEKVMVRVAPMSSD